MLWAKMMRSIVSILLSICYIAPLPILFWQTEVKGSCGNPDLVTLTLSGVFISAFIFVIYPTFIRLQRGWGARGPDKGLWFDCAAFLYGFIGVILIGTYVSMTYGIEGPLDKVSVDASDYYYFSIVTFTTLGYGDFRPCEAGRMYAAAHGLIGFAMYPFMTAAILRAMLPR